MSVATRIFFQHTCQSAIESFQLLHVLSIIETYRRITATVVKDAMHKVQNDHESQRYPQKRTRYVPRQPVVLSFLPVMNRFCS
jgi:hypothetical protein